MERETGRHSMLTSDLSGCTQLHVYISTHMSTPHTTANTNKNENIVMAGVICQLTDSQPLAMPVGGLPSLRSLKPAHCGGTVLGWDLGLWRNGAECTTHSSFSVCQLLVPYDLLLQAPIALLPFPPGLHPELRATSLSPVNRYLGYFFISATRKGTKINSDLQQQSDMGENVLNFHYLNQQKVFKNLIMLLIAKRMGRLWYVSGRSINWENFPEDCLQLAQRGLPSDPPIVICAKEANS